MPETYNSLNYTTHTKTYSIQEKHIRTWHKNQKEHGTRIKKSIKHKMKFSIKKQKGVKEHTSNWRGCSTSDSALSTANLKNRKTV